jgi:hypothetical protein
MTHILCISLSLRDAGAVSLRLTFPEKVRFSYRAKAAPDLPSQQSLDVLGSS